jgi:hypothetical protein
MSRRSLSTCVIAAALLSWAAAAAAQTPSGSAGAPPKARTPDAAVGIDLSALADLAALSSLEGLSDLADLAQLQSLGNLTAIPALSSLEGIGDLDWLDPLPRGIGIGTGVGAGRGLASDQSEDRTYQRGMKALDERQWEAAVEAFREVARQKGARADGATYWLAYAQNRLGQRAEALALIAELRQGHPQSRWIKQAAALELEIRQSSGQPANPESQMDDELKLMALNGLVNSDPERAVPLLEKFLEGNHPPRLKDRALFVLAQSESPKAREIMARIAREGNPDLQAKAIQYLGVHGSRENRQLLGEIYASSKDVAIKKRILQSFMVSGERGRLLSAATGESDPTLRAEAVRQLGVMGAHDELWQLYQKETSTDVKKQILQAMFVGGNADRLIELARDEKDPELRRRAVRNLGLLGSGRTGTALVSIYASDPAMRREVIQALFIQNNGKQLVEIARKETDPTLRKEIVQKLSIMGDNKDALDYLMEILNKG